MISQQLEEKLETTIKIIEADEKEELSPLLVQAKKGRLHKRKEPQKSLSTRVPTYPTIKQSTRNTADTISSLYSSKQEERFPQNNASLAKTILLNLNAHQAFMEMRNLNQNDYKPAKSARRKKSQPNLFSPRKANHIIYPVYYNPQSKQV